MRAQRAGQAARLRGRQARRGRGRPRKSRPFRTTSYARYPHYPQVESAWSDSETVTASGCGRDDPPATGESLPSHSPGGNLAGRLRAIGQAEADGRAADEAAARRTMAGLPSSGCESGMLRKRPSGSPNAFGREGKPSEPGRPSGTLGTGTGPKAFGAAERTGGTPDLRIEDQPGRKRGFRASALPPARKGLRFRKRSGRTGLRPGSCEPGVDPGLRLMAMPRRNQGFGRGSCRTRFRGLRPMKTGTARKRDASSKSAERRTARASALTGSQRGNRMGFGPEGLREVVGPGFRSRLPPLETAHREGPLRRHGCGGTVGPGSNAGPHYCLGARSPRATRPTRSSAPR